MLSQNNNALGIIFPNSYDNTVPELVTERTMASIPFAGRYRMVDFILSSMSNCGITYSGRVEALASILGFLENQKERYVVMCDANIAVNFDFNALLEAHQASGADITVAYQKTEIPEGRKDDNYTLTIDGDGRVTELLLNDYRPGC